MRSTLDIIIAVKDSQPVTEQELKYALLALSAMNHFAERDIDNMLDAIETGRQDLITLRASFVNQSRETRRFKSMKLPVDKYLGPNNIPGSPEYEKRMKMNKAIFKKATGIDL